MSAFTIPEDFYPGAPDLFVHLYRSQGEAALKNRLALTRPLFSFLLEGEKEVHFLEESVHC